MMLGLGLSGIANQGCDIGGFYGERPSPELFVRWVQNGVFQPRFSIHSCNNDNTVTEPWMYPSYTGYVRDAIKLRYRMIPYLYSLVYEAHVKGTPIMRPLFYEFSAESRLLDEDFTFMFGPALLVANVVEPDTCTRSVYLPAGREWYDWHTHKKYQGGQRIEVAAPLDTIPMFFPSGAIIPLAGTGINNLHHSKIDCLDILIEPSRSGSFLLYEDDGFTNEHEQGVFCTSEIKVVRQGAIVTIAVDKFGSYQSPVTKMHLTVMNGEKAPLEIRLGESILSRHLYLETWQACTSGWYVDNENGTTKIKYPNPQGSYEVTMSYEPKDLIGI
jgi:alpha-glucosidase